VNARQRRCVRREVTRFWASVSDETYLDEVEARVRRILRRRPARRALSSGALRKIREELPCWAMFEIPLRIVHSVKVRGLELLVAPMALGSMEEPGSLPFPHRVHLPKGSYLQVQVSCPQAPALRCAVLGEFLGDFARGSFLSPLTSSGGAMGPCGSEIQEYKIEATLGDLYVQGIRMVMEPDRRWKAYRDRSLS
jgi:hypothetical protein